MNRGSWPARALVVAGAVVLTAAFVVGYASRALFNADQFAERAAAALQDEAVADQVGVRVADGLIDAEPDLVAVKPILESATASIVRGSAFQSVFRAGVADLHRGFFARDQDSVVFIVADIGVTISGALQGLDPKLAAKIPTGADAVLVDDQMPGWAAALLQAADAASWLPWVLAAVALILLGAGFAVAGDRRTAAQSAGVSVAAAAVASLVVLALGKALFLAGVADPSNREAVEGIWDAFLSDLWTGLFLLAGCGAILAAAASSLLRPVDLGERFATAWKVATRTPTSVPARAARALALIAAGILGATHGEEFASMLAMLLGLLIAYVGASELMHMTLAEERGAAAPAGRRTLVAIIVAGVASLAAVGVFVGVGGVTQRSLAIETVGCNGSLDLCDRPYNEVATPATHNSMSAANYPGWTFAQQEKGIPEQLRAGVRGLLIDAHAGVETEGGTIKTDLSDQSSGKRDKIEDAMGADALDAALRIRDRIVNSPEVGEPGVYLCHAFCELGAITIDRGFTEIRDFVAANPDEVVTVVIEDYVPPADIAAAAERTGLLDFVYEGPVGVPWPTLQEMIDSGGRVMMMAENEAGGEEFPWYHSAYDSLVQETPFSFSKASQLTAPAKLEASCEPNRGSDQAGVFLVNHWIDTSPAPRPTNAAIVNTRRALLDRIHHCEEQRDLLATLVAIDFYEEGDVFGAIAALNEER